ncbi:hypothetical protein E6C60_2972 [Paenibacillus algicola]|uniref:HTH marR-type domain-containing protein n=1 Tax=Paenibacillus algicola TaxID=2565926 RepID=A0A4P8XMM4_9BACL|nr:hypothetical protein [Paenibacillus algicola]QCT03683.1 hypothetical protein E6C60_2972 [Paenibacillus algicola]
MKLLEHALRDLNTDLSADNPLLDRRLTTVQDYICHYVNARDYDRLVEIRESLLELVQELNHKDLLNFRLGRISALTEVIWGITADHRLMSDASVLAPKEQAFISSLHQHKEMTNSELSKLFYMEPNHTSNVLAKLRKLDFVFVRPSGKERWYSLTPIGENVARKLDEEQQRQQRKKVEIIAEDDNAHEVIRPEQMMLYEEEKSYFREQGTYQDSVVLMNTWGGEGRNYVKPRMHGKGKPMVQIIGNAASRASDCEDRFWQRIDFELCRE